MTATEKTLRKQKRERMFVRVIAALAIFALGGAVYAIVGTVNNTKEITQIQHSACAVNPASRECQAIKRESDEKQSIPDACVSFKKVGYSCPKPGSTAAEHVAEGGGAIQQPSNPASQQPGPATGPTAQTPTPQAPVAASPESHEEPSEPSAPPVSESANTAPIRETVESVVAPVQTTVCSLPIRLCP